MIIMILSIYNSKIAHTMNMSYKNDNVKKYINVTKYVMSPCRLTTFL